MGITQLSYFVRFFGGLISIILGVINQKRFDILGNVPKLFKLLTLIKPTFTNFGQVWDEFRDLDETEKEQLRVMVAIELDLDQDQDIAKINEVINYSLSFLELITKFKR